MLEGTDLFSAYNNNLSSSQGGYLSHGGFESQEEYYEPIQEKPQEKPQEEPPKVKPYKPIVYDQNIPIHNSAIPYAVHKQQPQPMIKPADDQKLMALVAEMKKKKQEPGYFDKLFYKKKELYKILQLSLIITFGISLHFLIDHYLSTYLSENEMSFERQLLLRLLYPLAILFIIWNIRVFVK